ncbi:MAG: DNA-processing protein DprA [Xanthomonadales bacterium]|nr:DNA-processing protein DprA [Xanthomonadales bacterium]
MRRPDPEQLDSDLEWLEAPGHHLLTHDDPRYPDLLRESASPPAALFAVGNPDLAWQPQVAIVGSRNPTGGGVRNARAFATELAERGFAVTSGLAEGIDATAHAAALDAGGATIAVTATGPDRLYPQRNRALAERIAEHGLLVTEFPPGTSPRRAHFPSRNRIIAALSLGTLVVEASVRSGALITARQAGEQGRAVFALPGSIHNPLARGCHRLIRDGARLVETADDIVEDLAPMAGRLASALRRQLDDAPARTNEQVSGGSEPTRPGPNNRHQNNRGQEAESPRLDPRESEPHVAADPEYERLWSSLGFDPAPVDRLVQQTGLTVQAVSSMLLMLELRGKVEAHPGGAYSRKT